MFKNVMLPIDGSVFSELALPLAVRIAQRSEARLHIVRVHAMPVATPELAINQNYDELIRDWERDALRVTAERARAARVEVSVDLLDGPVVDALHRYAELSNIDLIVMTTHGRSGIKRAVLGSVAEQCVRKTEIPIVLLRPRADEDPTDLQFPVLERILVPLDGSPESESVLPQAIRFARLVDAEIVLMRAAIPAFDVAITIGAAGLKDYTGRMLAEAASYLEIVKRELPDDVRATTVTVTGERTPDAILKCAEDHRAGLIAMATHGRSGWARIAVGSVAESVLHKSATPVLLIKGVTGPTSTVLHSERNVQARYGG